MLRLLARYDTVLQTHPLPTKMATAGLLSTSTDLALQSTAGVPPLEQDHHRTARQAIWSGVIMAPNLHVWMNVLARIPSFFSIPAPLLRLAVDTFTFMPASHVAYVAFLSTAAHGSAAHIEADMREKLEPLLRAGYAVIPPVMLVNLMVVPLRFRVLFINTLLGVGYGSYMNYVINRRAAAAVEPEAKERIRALARRVSYA